MRPTVTVGLACCLLVYNIFALANIIDRVTRGRVYIISLQAKKHLLIVATASPEKCNPRKKILLATSLARKPCFTNFSVAFRPVSASPITMQPGIKASPAPDACHLFRKTRSYASASVVRMDLSTKPVILYQLIFSGLPQGF